MPRRNPKPKTMTVELRRNIYIEGEFAKKGTRHTFPESLAKRLVAVGKAKPAPEKKKRASSSSSSAEAEE